MMMMIKTRVRNKKDVLRCVSDMGAIVGFIE